MAAEYLLGAVERKSYHHACNWANRCLREMPSPVWAEDEPGMAKYGPGEMEANQRLNALRHAVLTWMLGFIDPRLSWEASDEWPNPTKLRQAIQALRELCPE